MRGSSHIWLSASAAAIALTGARAALAEQASTATQLGEIVVTAQKRAENVQKVPVAITAVTGATLVDRGITSPTELQFVAPSMQAGRLLAATTFTIRGVGLNQGSPGVAVHVDGVYQPRSSMGDLSEVDIARVEVLRGPQGTLYGRNANGGVINFITQAPTNRLEGYVLGSYASYNESRLQGVINVPFGDRIRSRLVVERWERGDGFVKNVIPGGQDLDKGRTLAARWRLAADLTDTLKFDLSVTGLHGDGPISYFTLHGYPSALSVARNPWLANAIVPQAPRETSANDPVADSRDYFSAAGTFNWDLGVLHLKSISAFQRYAEHQLRDDDSINLSAFPSEQFDRAKTFTQEVNLSGKIGPVNAVVGGFYMWDSANNRLHYNFPLGIFPLPPGSSLDFSTTRLLTQSKAVFGDATWNLTGRARLIGGVRYSEDTISQTQQVRLGVGPFPPFATCPTRVNDVTFRSTTPRVGAQYELSSDSNVYFTYSKGFKAGGWNYFSCNNGFKPEHLTSYEIGWKSRLFDDRLILNASAFYYDYTDLQLSQVVGLVRLIENAAAAEVKGVELETAWKPDSHWTVNANASLISAKYTNFTNIDSLAPQLGPQNLNGHTLNNAPKFSTNIGVAYRTDPVVAGGRVTARADLSYRSKIFFREFNLPLDSQKGYAILDASLIWDSADEKYRVRLFANNLLGEDYIAQMDSSDNFGARYVSWGAPRQIGVELRANF